MHFHAPLVACAAVLLLAALAPTAAADRCTQNANGWSCTHQKRFNGYWCNGFPVTRPVRWQVPEGTPPRRLARRLPQIIHELLDNPAGTGRKYVTRSESRAEATTPVAWR